MSTTTTSTQQDPINLEQLYNGLTSADQPSEAKAQGIQVLYTVAHHPTVKVHLAKRPDVVKAIATGVIQRNPAFYAMRWQNLAVIGELCRRENRGDVDNLPERNALSQTFVGHFAKISWFVSALKDLSREDDSDDSIQTAEIAADLLKVIPHSADTSTTADAKLGEEDLGDGFTWSKDQRECAKDLLFVDPTETKQMEVLPFVVRVANNVCGNCQSKVAEDGKILNRCVQCKAAFYCNATCQKEAWAAGHKTVCGAWKKTRDPAVFPALFFETRSFLYATRPENLQKLNFYDFFLQYSPKYHR